VKKFEVMVNPYRGGPDDWALRALPSQLIRMLENAESGFWDPEPGDLRIDFTHEITSRLNGEPMQSIVGASCISGQDALPIVGEVIFLDDIPVRVDEVDISDEAMSCVGGGMYTYCAVAVTALAT
jgi:hypothetical protein